MKKMIKREGLKKEKRKLREKELRKKRKMVNISKPIFAEVRLA